MELPRLTLPVCKTRSIVDLHSIIRDGYTPPGPPSAHPDLPQMLRLDRQAREEEQQRALPLTGVKHEEPRR